MTDKIVPVRGAAQKATVNIAEQLTDSPGHSEPDSPSLSNPFREPTARSKSVKYRYTATGKHLSSPLKGNPSSPERKPDKPKKLRLTTLTPAPPSHAAKGKAPAVATASRKRKASAAHPRKEDLLDSIFRSSPSPLSSLPSSPITSTKDLPPSPTVTAKHSASDIPKRRSISKTFSLHSLGTTASKFSVASQPLSPKRKQKKTKSNGADAWDIGNSVWVLVNQSGVPADKGAHPQSDIELSESLMWWPAQVVQKQPLCVSMFGDFPSSSSTNRGLCTIFAPSSSNILSINDDSGAKRFLLTTFHLTSGSVDSEAGPPAKKPRLDDIASMEARWEAAVQSMDKASTLEKDGLPALISTYATTGGCFYDSLDDSDPDTPDLRQSLSKAPRKIKAPESTRKLKPQGSKANLKDDVPRPRNRLPSLCPPDLTLQIPGELILALAPRTGASYWPAKVLKHVPSHKEKYRVRFLDDEEYEITRDKFFTSEEEGFVRCRLGEWESAIKTTDDPESGDEDEKFGVADADVQYLDDSALPPPPPAKDFEVLSVRAQISYVKPVLRAILTKSYAPAREKHESFMRGGSSRVELLKSAGVRGGMDARFVKAVQKVICEWVLGDSRVGLSRSDAEAIVNTNSEAEGGSAAKVVSPEVVPTEKSHPDPVHDDKMEGIEGTGVPEGLRADKNNNTAKEALPSTAPDEQVAQVTEMVVDVRQDPVPLPRPENSVRLSPTIQQAALAPRSQLDLLAEVSQAVATEPSLLPSHPEVPKLKIQLLDITRKDASPQPSPLTPIAEEDQPFPPRRSASILAVCEEFEILTGVEKLDYCLNILLPESIQQLLLWRCGERTSSALLPPEEEQRLHEVGARKAAETDWVDDLMRLRAAQARLWRVDLNKKAEEKTEVVQGGTRSRPRLAAVSRP